MNLGFDFRNLTLDGLRGSLEALVARVNTIWKKEHDPTDGTHTDVTADSITAETVTVTQSLVVVPSDPSPPGLIPLLTAEEDEFGTRVVVDARHTLLSPVQITSISQNGANTAISLSGEFNTAPANLPANGMVMGAIVSTPATGTHSLITSLNLASPSVFSGGATVTDTAGLYIASASAATVTGANYSIWVDAGTSRFDGLINAVGGQIQFPATQVSSANANTLDDYEEGSFNATSPNITYASGTFNYQKIGSWVHITGFLVFPATADANQAEINNLPFTVENSSQALGGCVSHFGNSGLSVGLIAINNTTRALLQTPTTTALITNAALTGATLFFDFKYRATA